MRFLESKFTVEVAVVLLLAAFAGCQPAQASTILVTTESGIAADGLVDWGVLGPVATVVPQPFSLAVPGIAGLNVDVSRASPGTLRRSDQAPPLVDLSFTGDFAPGEKLIYTNRIDNVTGGPLALTFDFDHPVQGVGAQVESVWFGPFTATIQAFDSSGSSLGSFSAAGSMGGLADDSALFIGILSDAFDIDKVTFSVVSCCPSGGAAADDFLINGPRIQASAPVPEPATMILLLTGALGVRLGLRPSARKT